MTGEEKLARAEAIIEMLRVFYPKQVAKAEKLADMISPAPPQTTESTNRGKP